MEIESVNTGFFQAILEYGENFAGKGILDYVTNNFSHIPAVVCLKFPTWDEFENTLAENGLKLDVNNGYKFPNWAGKGGLITINKCDFPAGYVVNTDHHLYYTVILDARIRIN